MPDGRQKEREYYTEFAKAVLVLLSLLHLGVQKSTLGPRLPAFISPAVLNVLVENFGIRANTTVEEDLKLMA